MITLQLPKVPVPDAVAMMIGTSIPLPVLQAEVDAFEAALSRLARANKTLAKHDPRLIVRGAA
jgi:hypothetical protein